MSTCYAMAENVFAVTQGGVDALVTVDTISLKAFLQEGLARPVQDGEEPLRQLSAGRPIDNTRVCILDDQRRLLPER
ncbi:MAG: hypothetical protein EHM70_25880, partial [Chloroflexota bacterium]